MMMDAAPTTCALCGDSATALTTCAECQSVAYCRGRTCAWLHRPLHQAQCEEIKAERIDEVLVRTGNLSSYTAASRGDMIAVRDLVHAGLHVEIADGAGWSAAFYAVWQGQFDVLVYLVEDCRADVGRLSHYQETLLLVAAMNGRTAIVRYLGTKTPELVDVPNDHGLTALMCACINNDMDLVLLLVAGLGCSLSPKQENGFTALDYARSGGHAQVTRLLSDIDAAGGYRQYAAARRMAYVRIRHQVQKAGTVLPEGLDEQELFHFVFGRNRDTVGDQENKTPTPMNTNTAGTDQETATSVAKLPKTNRRPTLPAKLFAQVIGHL